MMWICGSISGQKKSEIIQDEKLLGSYVPEIDSILRFNIKKENGRLMIEIEGQGKTELDRVSENRFKAKKVRPDAFIEFAADSSGNVEKLKWIQILPTFEWDRFDTPATTVRGSPDTFVGQYRLKGNNGQILTVRNENGILSFQSGVESKHNLIRLSDNIFRFERNDFSLTCDFKLDESGIVRKVITTRKGPITCLKISGASNETSKHIFGTKTPFTAADTLRGMLTPLRSCYDVLFYNLDVVINPSTKSLSGSNTIRFQSMQAFDKMQIDLFANMSIEKILFHDQPLMYVRKYDAVFIDFPQTISANTIEEIKVYYSGKPQLPDPATLKGGFLWYYDKNGKLWMESVCQGSGASLWWPCKDHLSDEPDSMKINVTVPRGLTEISNGKLLSKSDIAGDLTRYEWYVSYPINNYNVAVNIGDYIHLTDEFVYDQDSLAINYYCLSYNADRAKQIFSHVRSMLGLYTKDFGFYPFKRDGFTVMEALYPMEHQGAVSIGSINNPVLSDNYDSAESIRTMWHEAGHEWWGNSISCKDIADLWIHEAFATYAEVLCYETFYDKAVALKYLKGDLPKNEEPIIGHYDVNDFRLGDMYSKGALMIHTFRNVLDNDSLFFSVLRGMQSQFKYRTVTTNDIVSYINKSTGRNLTGFFDQYLRYPAIPEIRLRVRKNGSSLQVGYRWKTDVNDFNIPIKVTAKKDKFDFIYPTAQWQTIQIDNMSKDDFKVDTDGFFIKVTRE